MLDDALVVPQVMASWVIGFGRSPVEESPGSFAVGGARQTSGPQSSNPSGHRALQLHLCHRRMPTPLEGVDTVESNRGADPSPPCDRPAALLASRPARHTRAKSG
jgi:hypothetical protein